MEREEKIEYATWYCQGLVAKYSGIVGVILGGSLVRGNDLPISDIDLWCFIDDSDNRLPIEKHTVEGVFIDIEQHPSELLTRVEIGEDPYICGYLNDAMILFDRDGQVHDCQRRVRAYIDSPTFRKAQLSSIRASVERNYRAFSSSLETRDAGETCRSSIFTVWSLCDYMLAVRSISPGGARGLARLAGIWADAANAIVEFEGSTEMDGAQIDSLRDTYLGVADRSPFFEMWLEKVEWMLANGYRPDAFHALWIALGLRIKDARAHSGDYYDNELEKASRRWLATIGWDHLYRRKKLVQLRELIDLFCHKEIEE